MIQKMMVTMELFTMDSEYVENDDIIVTGASVCTCTTSHSCTRSPGLVSAYTILLKSSCPSLE